MASRHKMNVNQTLFKLQLEYIVRGYDAPNKLVFIHFWKVFTKILHPV